MWIKLRNMIAHSCDLLELFMAVLVLLATIVAIISLWHPFVDFLKTRYEAEALLTFVGYVFNVLISIEFLKMLCRPSSDTVLEVLIFLVARHMIIGDTSVPENFLSILSIAALFAMKKYLHLPSPKESTNIFVSDEEWEKFKKKRKAHQEKTSDDTD
jgi:uncharacterized membrane protein (DUF373 family)